MQWLLSLKLVALLTVANGIPAVAWRVFGEYFNRPMDGGVAFFDKQPIFGPSKTIRGIILSLAAATACAPLLGLEWVSGLYIGGVAMFGDLASSFLKRRLNLPPSSRAIGIDQIPECLLPTLAVRSTLGLGVFDVIFVVIIFFFGHITLSQLFFRWKIRNRPY
jgi:CDP-archaeol synthase